MEALAAIESWPVEHAAAGVVRADGVVAARGDTERLFRWASITKLVTALAVLVAAEEGVVDLDEPAGPEGSTVRHLLAHASGLPFESDGAAIGRVGARRIYSNEGFEQLARHLEAAAEMPFADYLREAVLEPLGMTRSELRGTAAAGLWGPLEDLLRLGRELLAPTIVAPETLAEATQVAFPGLDGVLPDFGRMTPNDWGLGFEIRDAKPGHWMGTAVSPRAFGHFGGSGTFLWVDPELGAALGVLTDRPFGRWAKEAWPPLSDAVVAELP
ncbi:MAG TPA: serine hydrolase domain-containing protein [Gaiellaceae bacterium]|nr:serine hydrolase domain-containing protein [Gaiellaceae bacterium]